MESKEEETNEDKGENILTKETVEEIDENATKKNLQKVEAALFIAGKFLSLQELIALTDLNPILIRELIEELQEEYEKMNSAIEIVRQPSADSWKMDVNQDFVYMVNKLATGKSEFTKAEQETLALISYKQPVKQSIIVKIRGNKSYDHIKKFFEMGLVRKRRLGRTWELNVSEDFYDYFQVGEGGEKTEKREEEE